MQFWTKVTFHHHDDDGHAHMEEGKKRGEHHGIVRTLSLDKVDEHPDEKKKPSKGMDSVGSENILSEGRQTVCCGITPVGVMVLIGDILHNFGDGLALGVAFSSSWFGGLGASIAIFCHELPHEFGDFAIYIKNGMSKWKALGLNFLAACFAFVGLYIGLSVAENSEVRQWLLAVIAGMFLYISLVDVLHEMIEEKSEKHPILQFFLQNLGICLGWAILFLLALYEDQIRSSINA
ncbi:unnamed protein product [Clavelina lepadiformis]|uniref:Uncharacterized protein n=1 Tax=Clavelina lepadiformis TaxID=159417 RepID=A0ABP0F829_CLALP